MLSFSNGHLATPDEAGRFPAGLSYPARGFSKEVGRVLTGRYVPDGRLEPTGFF